MRIAFLFAGQGSQKVGMIEDLYHHYPLVQELYHQAVLSFDARKLTFEGPQTMLDETQYAQSSIYLASYAISQVLKHHGIVAEKVAGLSLGEYTALAYAEAFSFEDGLHITQQRGHLMQAALPLNESGMLAVIQADVALIEQACQAASSLGICSIANYNCPGQIVVTGENQALGKVTEILKEAGVRRIIPLRVSGAFHSELLHQAALELHQFLQDIEISQPKIPVLYNCYGKESAEDLRDIMKKQMTSSVYFWQSIEQMMSDGIDTFIEIGPGRSLAGFTKKISAEVSVYSVDDMESLKTVLEVFS